MWGEKTPIILHRKIVQLKLHTKLQITIWCFSFWSHFYINNRQNLPLNLQNAPYTIMKLIYAMSNFYWLHNSSPFRWLYLFWLSFNAGYLGCYWPAAQTFFPLECISKLRTRKLKKISFEVLQVLLNCLWENWERNLLTEEVKTNYLAPWIAYLKAVLIALTSLCKYKWPKLLCVYFISWIINKIKCFTL